MSRRASLFARQNPGRRRVRFPDEVVFDDSVRENDTEAVMAMLRRTSVDIEINRTNSAGLTALHQAALDGNLPVVRILVRFGADVNCRDEDSWTPLHAACSMGHHHVARFLVESGADPHVLTQESQRPLDLVQPSDMETVAAILSATLESQSEAGDSGVQGAGGDSGAATATER
ncbi:protein phosphatase 1 regulatory subunit 27-like [Pollicipes pollicipes]|uniref:protein phosphatase 1 regulatory subunit 27-like n=1 Tax=Pollicipes pollicipes TaxID=41117 RepID=UPI001884E028|nr:protein phosphatase 1 regulatory subunit 27-like [Pollicipes pollicipes]XP_037072517.1 protein phosphatase 1 regulatory subunit 27-like [Pollicipes pollicipes]